MSTTNQQQAIKEKPKESYYCGFYFKGNCHFGTKCYSLHELMPRHMIYENIPCRRFLQGGVCPYGNRCWFSHCIPKKFKSKLCRNFEKNGYCPQGGACTFAHGEKELDQTKVEALSD